MRTLLLSSSTVYGTGYLDFAASEIAGLFEGIGRILFVPFALHDQVGYWTRARDRFAAWGIEVDRLEEGAGAPRTVQEARGIFVGGGNTFRLLDRLQRSGLVEPIRQRTRAGMPYLGASAGTVIAAPTMRTTNDMPIVAPASLEALGLVRFQINCHYLDPDPGSHHMGETRETRLREFLEENDAVVVGLREGAMLSVQGDPDRPRVTLEGIAGARVFSRGVDPAEHLPGASLDHLAAPG
jgi:dipeptidase E